jgi:hypothetical protein
LQLVQKTCIVPPLFSRELSGKKERRWMEMSTRASTQSSGYGLRREVLSPMETLAQSVSTIAPTTTPAATIPLVCALAGNGTWLAYCLSADSRKSILNQLSSFFLGAAEESWPSHDP